MTHQIILEARDFLHFTSCREIFPLFLVNNSALVLYVCVCVCMWQNLYKRWWNALKKFKS